jgi:hypothetical protein
VGPQMTRLAGEVADGVMLHPTNASPRAIEVLILPELERGAARSARRGSEVAVLASGFVATGPDLAAVRGERERIRAYLGFLYSTPAYRPTLELFGWQEVGVRLRELSRERRWQDMPALVDDAMLDALVPSGPYAEIADVLRAYAGLATGVAFPLPADPAHDASARQVIESLRGTAG